MQNKPNFGQRSRMSGGDAQPTKRRNAQNEPNLARRTRRGWRKTPYGVTTNGGTVQNKAKLGGTGVCGQRMSRGAWPGRTVKRAKRSQTWGDWGMWAKADVVRGVDRPDSETCKTNPIWGPGAPRLRIGDCGLWIGRGWLRTDAGDQVRKTNPIGPGRRVNAQNKANSVRPDLGCPGGGVKCGVAGVRSERSSVPPSGFKLQTSNFTLAHGQSCKTNPICERAK
jgi:hypothetical protein